jgi:hypothetical protein
MIFSFAIQPFRGGAEGSEFLVARSSSDDFRDEPAMLLNGHVLNEAMVIDEEGTGLRVLF